MTDSGDDHAHPSLSRLEEWDRRMSAPENEAPAALAFSAVLGRTDETAVCLTAFRVYSTGLEFSLAVRLRKEPRGQLGHRVHELVSGHGSGMVGGVADEILLLGVEYADGRTATNITSDRHSMFEQGDPQSVQPLLHGGGGGGGGRTYDHDFWLSPLPSDGPVTFVVRWGAFGIEESRTVLDGGLISSALPRVETLWPWEPIEHQHEEEPEDFVFPTDGWFGDVLRRQRDR